MITIKFDSAGWDWATTISVAGLILALITTGIAIHVARIATKIRNLDWIKVQNEAWNTYNALKLDPANAPAFQNVDTVVAGLPVPANVLKDYATRTVMYCRMNIQERDFRALLYRLIRNYDGHYLVNEIRLSRQNATIISKFLVDGGYDPMFVMFYRRVARAFAQQPNLSTRDLDVFQILKSIRSDHALGLTNDHLPLLPGMPV